MGMDAAGKRSRWKRAGDLLKAHLHIALYTYFWFGLFVCGLAAPPHRVESLGSGVVTRGWQLSLLSTLLLLPVPLVYALRMRAGARRGPRPAAGVRRTPDP